MNDTVDLLQIKIEHAKEKLPEDTLNAINAVDWKSGIFKIRETKGYNLEQLAELELETELLLCGLVLPEDYEKELSDKMNISRTEANELVHDMNEFVFKKIKQELIRISEHKKIVRNEVAPAPEIKRGPIPPKITEPEKPAPNLRIDNKDAEILESAGIVVPNSNVVDINAPVGDPSKEKRGEILANIENPDSIKTNSFEPQVSKVAPLVHPILQEKMLNPVQIPKIETQYSLNNTPKAPAPSENIEVKNEASKVVGYERGADPYRLSPEE